MSVPPPWQFLEGPQKASQSTPFHSHSAHAHWAMNRETFSLETSVLGTFLRAALGMPSTIELMNLQHFLNVEHVQNGSWWAELISW